jgi:hypothetical protein
MSAPARPQPLQYRNQENYRTTSTFHGGLVPFSLVSPVLLSLRGGPLDGVIQVVEMLPITQGDELFFSVPHYQAFDPNQPDTEVLIGMGLQATYALAGPGPNPGPGDSWVSSWIFDFTGEAYVPAPAPLPPPGPLPPVALTQVWMAATTTLVPDTIPVTSEPVVTLVAESDLDVDAEVTPVQAGVVNMTGETVMSVTPDWTPQVFMNAQSSITWPPEVHLNAQSGMVVTPS